MNMHEMHGLWWPDLPAHPDMQGAYLRSAEDMTLAMSHVRKFDVVVQAGGHCGEWAIWLSRKFKTVYTFEPDQWNFACLTRNTASYANIFAAHGFLGHARGPIDLCRSQEPSLGGSHHGLSKAGLIPVYRVDDLQLPDCDAMILDVEGMEYPALKGALETIQKFAPVIQIENWPQFAAYGWGCYDDIRSQLLPDYIEVGRINYDVVLVHR